jgi:hypothetical protein
MKKLFLVMMVMCSVFAVNAMSFRQAACYMNGLNPSTADTTTITPTQRIMAMHIVMCARAAGGAANYVRVNYNNYEQFTEAQFVEFYTRGMNGSMQQLVMAQMVGSANVQQYHLACTDAQLETSYLNKMFGVIKLIGNGSL